MSHGKQFTLYSHTMGPNGWFVISSSHRSDTHIPPNRKVAIVLEELGLSFHTIFLLVVMNGRIKAGSVIAYDGRPKRAYTDRNGAFWILLEIAVQYSQVLIVNIV